MALVRASRESKRVIGRRVGAADGPTVIVMGGIHGNEPSGVEAAARVISRLERERLMARGEFVALAGNLRALKENTRFIDRDLNRQWIPEKIAALRTPGGRGAERVAEIDEQLELLEVIASVIQRACGRVYFVDLHTYSSDGPPFLTVGDTLRNRQFAMGFPLPLILGLEEQVDGALLEYLNNLGCITLGLEAGRHDHPGSVDRQEALLWLLLAATGLVEKMPAADLERFGRRLSDASRGIPRIVEVRHRHAIESDDEFRMEPGFENFQPVRRGAVMARDKHGLVLAPTDGLVLLPLYQGKGNDGYFVAREVHPLWLRISTVLRRLRLAVLLRLLPGVRGYPGRPEVLIVDTRIARVYPLEVFHLFGFRKLRFEGAKLLVSRRRHDLTPPRQVSFG